MTNDQSDKRKGVDPDTEETTEDFLSRRTANGEELREAIEFLIHRRELLRDAEIESLESQCELLVDILAEKKNRILLEELDCFREILSLHKRLATEHDQSGD